MALPDVRIIKSAGGLGRQKPTEDGISALITQGTAVAGKLALDTVYELRSVRQAEALGILATGLHAPTHRHISEYFRLSPGAILLLMVVAQDVSLTEMCDRTLAYGKKLLQAQNGRVKQLAVALNPAPGYVPVISGGLDADVLGAVTKAQALASEEFAEHRPVCVLVAGHGLATATSDATDLRSLLSEYVGVVVATDHLLAPGVPAIGAALGTLSAAKVHECIGWVGRFQLAGDGSFLSAGLSNGKALGELLPGELVGLHEKGYILALQHAGLDGFFFNGSSTCTGVDSDYATLENVRTTNKAATIVRRALLPQVNGPLALTAQGKLQPQVIAELEANATTALEVGMGRPGEVSALDVYIDPDQDVVSTGVLQVKFSLVPVGVATTIEAEIGLTKSL